jgi:transposase
MPKSRSFGTEISANRQRNHQFTPVQKAVIVEQLSSGKSHRAVAAEFRTTPSTTHAIFKRWREDGTLESRPRLGAPRKLSDAEERYIIMLVKRNRKITWKELQNAVDTTISISTLRSTLHEHYHRKWKSIVIIPLSEEAVAKRLAFAHLWLPNIAELKMVVLL